MRGGIYEAISTRAPDPLLRDTGRKSIVLLRYTSASEDYHPRGDYESCIKEAKSLLAEGVEDPSMRAGVSMMLGYALIKSRKIGDAAKVFKELLASPDTPPLQRGQAKESLANLNSRGYS